MLLSIVAVPLVGALFTPLAGRVSQAVRNNFSFLLVAVPLILVLRLVPAVLSGAVPTFIQTGILGFDFSLSADGLAVFMAVVSALLSAVIVLYSFGYISHYENQDEYYFMVVLFFGAMMGLVFSTNLVILYVFWEITAITSWRLIGFFQEKSHLFKADKAFLVTVFGALAMLAGFIILCQQYGSWDLSVIKARSGLNPPSPLACFLILAGILSKSATLPFHTWLPDAGVAPSPVTALLHAAILVKIGVYVFARIFLATLTPPQYWQTFVLVVAAASALVSAGAALKETDLKRLIAYSTVSQVGFIFFGLAVTNPMAVSGGLLYILMHGIAKAGLFLCAGIVEQNTKTKDITKLGGLITAMPVTAISFLFCAFSVMGVPPFGGFFCKYLVFSGAIAGGRLFISGVFLIGAFLTILYLFRVFNLVFLGEGRFPDVKEKNFLMVASVAFLAALSLLGGVLVNYPLGFAQAAASNILGIMK
jgi:NADH:ubiquinone oxidoreductase subunit 5 (subunit L)/multisubunit Na+/H+ antiporter MnhA subunit